MSISVRSTSKPVIIVVTLVLFLLPLYARSLWVAKSTLDVLSVGSINIAGRVALLKKTIAWDAPFNSYSEKAKRILYQTISQIPDKSQKLEGLRELKSALKSSRSFFRPEEPGNKSALLVTVEQEIAQIEGPSTSLRETYPATVNHRVQILAQIFFWGWIILVIVGIFRGFSKEGKPNYSQLCTFISLAFLSYGLWLISLRYAS